MLGHHGANLHELHCRNESRTRHAYAVDAKGQTLRRIAAVVANRKVQMKLIALADQFARGAEDRALRIAHFDLQFSAIPLRSSRQREKPRASQQADHPNESRHLGLDVVPASVSCTPAGIDQGSGGITPPISIS